ncbi:MAG TPA: hypothetical protein VIC62_17080 [Nakamurella sp.]|jgi:hypothetical protein
MPGQLLHVGATVLCMHGGQAQPTVPIPRVLLGGQPAVGQSAPYVVAGCPLVPPPPGPCVTAQWVVAATRVTSGGVPLVLQDSTAVCAPTGTGLQVLVVQLRVKGT